MKARMDVINILKESWSNSVLGTPGKTLLQMVSEVCRSENTLNSTFAGEQKTLKEEGRKERRFYTGRTRSQAQLGSCRLRSNR